MQSALGAAVRQLEEMRVMVLEGGRVNVVGTARKLNVGVFSSVRQPSVPQGLCLGNWQKEGKGPRMDIFSSRPKLYCSEAYSLDLVSSDFHLFEYIKEAIRGRRLADDEVNEAVYDWLRPHQKPFILMPVRSL